MVYMFSQWTEASLQTGCSLFCGKSPWKEDPYLGNSLQTSQWLKQSILLARYSDKSAVWLVLQLFHCAYHLQSSDLIEHQTASSLRLSQIYRSLQTPWSKTLLSVLLNLGSSPFETYKLLSFEIAPEFPMHLALTYFKPQLVKREIFQYCKD